jgi:GntR family transcriptional regulator
MIRLWLSREQSIPMREQLSTQLLLGIVSRRLPAGERLPSVRELARRLHIHPNTVSAAYRDLALRGWVQQRKGSGVFVRDLGLAEREQGIEGFVRAWIEAGATQGFSVAALESTLARVAHEPRAEQFLVVDPDHNLARILAAEISEALGYAVPSVGFEELLPPITSETCILALPAHAQRTVKEFNPGSHMTIILQSMEGLVVGHRRPTTSALIGLVSRSESIHRWSSTLLSALGFPPAAVLLRSPDKPQWKRGLSACTLVAADIEAFPELPVNVNGTLMRLVSPAFLAELTSQANKRSA